MPFLRLLPVFLVLPWMCASAAEVRSQILEQAQAKPIANLPQGIAGEAGKVTLHADYAQAGEGRITLYLINRSEKALAVPTQDGDPYVKLEARSEAGSWERAQAHGYSDCGNSYMTTPLPDGTFLALVAPYPTKGEKRTVRYRMYSDVGAVSNEGEGLADPKLIEQCRYDAMAIRFGDAKVVEHVLFNGTAKANDETQWPDLRQSAIHRLEHISPAEAAPLLKRLLAESGLKDHYYGAVIRIMSAKAPGDLAAFAKEVLSEGMSPRRTRLRGVAGYLQDSASLALLQALVKDPATPDAEGFLGAATSKGDAEARALLSSIAEGNGYRQNLRHYAAYLTEERLENLPVRVDIAAAGVGDADKRLKHVVTLTNEREEPVSFFYTRPEEIVGFSVWWYTAPPERLIRFVPVRETANFFKGDEKAKPTQVVLKKGEKLSLNFDLLDYFDLSSCAKESRNGLFATPRVRLPGIQSAPAASKSSLGIYLP